MVAFSGNPVVKGDRRYLINAQVGEYEMVSPDPGDWPEQDLLTMEGGEVTKIDWVSVSSRSPGALRSRLGYRVPDRGHIGTIRRGYGIDAAQAIWCAVSISMPTLRPSRTTDRWTSTLNRANRT